MRRRLYFLLPDVKQAREMFRDLLLARIEERHVHFLARDGVSLKDLPEATLLQKSDAIHGLGVGLIVGGATGAVAGLVVWLFPPLGIVTNLGLILVLSLVGAFIGVWVSGMVAADIPNSHLARFRKDVEHGKILAMVDIPKARIDEVTALVHRHHPEIVARGRDPTIPAFP
jgi:hypothetical protein